MNNELPFSCNVIVIGGENAGFCVAVLVSSTLQSRGVILSKNPQKNGQIAIATSQPEVFEEYMVAWRKDVLLLIFNVDAETAELIDLEAYTTE